MTYTLLFDLDETLYPREVGIMDQFRARVLRYICTELRLPRAEAEALRRTYLQEYGTTLRGLQLNHYVDAESYLSYVHDIPLERYLGANPELDTALAGIPLPKVVFTNASREHAERVLGLLGIRRHFGRVVDIRDLQYESKPLPAAYRRVCGILGVIPQECVIVEDSIRNIGPAKALGMATILVGSVGGVPGDGVDVAIGQIEQIGMALAHLALPPPPASPVAGDKART
jgi:putative hydrolase of the HAD superfamily